MPETPTQAAARVVLDHPWARTPYSAHAQHRYDAACGVCRGDVPAILAVAAQIARDAFSADADPATTPRTAPEPTETGREVFPRVVGSPDESGSPESPTALRERIAAAIETVMHANVCGDGPCLASFASDAAPYADAVLAVRDDELTARRAEVQRMMLARNGANAMKGVHKRQADRLRTELKHAKAALAGDNEAVRAFMADHEAKVQRLREQVSLWQHEAEQAESAIERVRDLHSEFRVYEPCGHATHEDDQPVIELDDIGTVCRSGYMYSICRECCAPGDAQTEDCVDNHHPGECWPCPTLRALDQPATEEQAGDDRG